MRQILPMAQQAFLLRLPSVIMTLQQPTILRQPILRSESRLTTIAQLMAERLQASAFILISPMENLYLYRWIHPQMEDTLLVGSILPTARWLISGASPATAEHLFSKIMSLPATWTVICSFLLFTRLHLRVHTLCLLMQTSEMYSVQLAFTL